MKSICFLLFAVLINSVGYTAYTIPELNSTSTFIQSSESVSLPVDENYAIQISSVDGLTEEEAVNLCFEVLGEKDESTGYELLYRCIGVMENENMQYYVMNVDWFVDNHHWSNVGNIIVSANGDEIYDAISQNGNYVLGEKIWERTQEDGSPVLSD